MRNPKGGSNVRSYYFSKKEKLILNMPHGKQIERVIDAKIIG